MSYILDEKLKALKGPILITGHTGFKGTWLTLLLEKLGVPVVGYSLAPEPESLFARAKRTGAIPEAFQDIRDYKKVSEFISIHEPSAIIHMAAQPLVLESYKTPRATFETNVMGTVNLLDAAFECPSVRAIVVVTTDKVYRNDNSGRAFIESDPLAGKDPYSASKVGTEAAVAAWQQIAKVSGGPKIISARAGNVIGGGDWAADRLLPDLIKSLIEGTRLVVRNAESTRPWQHVLDPLSGYLILLGEMLRGAELSSINFGPAGRSLSVREVVDLAFSRWPNSPTLSYEKAHETQEAESIELQIDAELASKTLHWSACWTQEEAVISTVDWWKRVELEGTDPSSACQTDINYLLDRIQLSKS